MSEWNGIEIKQTFAVILRMCIELDSFHFVSICMFVSNKQGLLMFSGQTHASIDKGDIFWRKTLENKGSLLDSIYRNL